MRLRTDPAVETFGYFSKYDTMGDVHTVLQSETLVERNMVWFIFSSKRFYLEEALW
jgi:hypothetical protein